MFGYNNCEKPDLSRGELIPDTSDEKIQGMRLRMEKKPFKPSLISETPVSIYKDGASTLDIYLVAPRKSMMFLNRTQMPPAKSLVEKWPWKIMVWKDPLDMFYETGDLCLYQLKENGESNPISNSTLLSTVDWDMLSMAMHDFLWCDSSPASKHVKSKGSLITFPTVNELKERRILFSATWEINSDASGRWFYHANLRAPRITGPTNFDYSSRWTEPDVIAPGDFQLRVFTPVVVVPITAWREHMGKMKEKIDNLFRSCRSWKGMVALKRRLSLEDTPSAGIENTLPNTVSTNPL